MLETDILEMFGYEQGQGLRYNSGNGKLTEWKKRSLKINALEIRGQTLRSFTGTQCECQLREKDSESEAEVIRGA